MSYEICLFFISTVLLTSCGSFDEGLLAGLAGMGNSYGGGYSGVGAGFTNMPSTTDGNMDYLLDSSYAVAQTIAQQAQYSFECKQRVCSLTAPAAYTDAAKYSCIHYRIILHLVIYPYIFKRMVCT